MENISPIGPKTSTYIIPENFENADPKFVSDFKQTIIQLTQKFGIALAVPLDVSQDFNPTQSKKKYSPAMIEKMQESIAQEKVELHKDRILDSEMDITTLAKRFQKKLQVMVQHGRQEKFEKIAKILDEVASTEKNPEILTFLGDVKSNVEQQTKQFEKQNQHS